VTCHRGQPGHVGPIDKGAAQAATRQGVFAWLRPPSGALFTCVRGEPSAGLETCDTAGLEACATGAGSKCTRCVAQAWNAAGFFTDGWCNGVYLGRHEGGYIPFEFDLTDALTRNDGRRTGLLVLRVEDPMDNHEQPVGKQWRWYTTVSGIWQTVFIEPRASSHIDSFRITPDLDGATAHFVVRCSDGGGGSIRVRVTAPDGTKLPEAEFPGGERDGAARGTGFAFAAVGSERAQLVSCADDLGTRGNSAGRGAHLFRHAQNRFRFPGRR